MGLISRVPFKKIDAPEIQEGEQSRPNPIASFLKEIDFKAYAEQLKPLDTAFQAAGTQIVEAPLPGKKLSRIVGVERYLSDLRMILSSSGARNAWIKGARGIGKTSIMEALLRLRAEDRLGSKLMSKPAYLIDVSTFFKFERVEWVKQFEAAMQYAGSHRGLVVIDHFDDFIRMADGESARLVNTMVSALENCEGMQAVIISDQTHDQAIRESGVGIERLFEDLVIVDEPTTDQMRNILTAHFMTLERAHNVDFTASVADEMLRLMDRYPGRAFIGARPKTLLKFADRVATYVRQTQYSEPPEVTLLREEVANLADQVAIFNDSEKKANQAVVEALTAKRKEFVEKDAAWRVKFKPLFDMRRKIATTDAVISQFEQKGTARSAAEDQIYGRARKEKQELLEKVAATERSLAPQAPEVTAMHVKMVFANASGVPLSNLSQDRLQRLAALTPALNAQIFKQEPAKTALARIYRARELGVSDPSRPAGVIAFLGGTGLGKSELVKALVRFDGGDSAEPVIIRLSEFADKSSVKKLTGADPGLVGYDDGAQLLEPLRINPRAFLLLDEADKAHPALFDVLMQMFEEGLITTSQGIKIPLKDTIIVMAMNGLTACDFESPEEMANEESVRAKMLQMKSADGQPLFRPEFLGRIDSVVVFQDLEEADAVKIFGKELNKVNADYRDRGLSVKLDDAPTNTAIVHQYHVAALGGRSARAIVKKHVRPLLTDYALLRAMRAAGQELTSEQVSLTIDDAGIVGLNTTVGHIRADTVTELTLATPVVA